MMTKTMSAWKWLAVLALGALAFERLGGATTAAMTPAVSRPEANESFDVGEPAAPASLQARVVELEAASEELAAKLARARRELSEP